MMAVEDYGTYKAAEWLWKVISPILIILGTMGNVLVIIVLTRRKFQKTPISVFLISLAVSDILVLNTGLLRQWITYAFHVDIRTDLTEGGCKVHWFIVYVTTQFSSWMLICVTTERLINTCLPHKRNFRCTFKRAYIAVCAILGVLVVLNGHYLIGYGTKVNHVNNVTVIERCVPLTSSYDEFIVYQWTWIDLCVFYLIPMLVMIPGNSIIAYKVIKSHRRSRAVAPAAEPSMAVIYPGPALETQQQQQQIQQRQQTNGGKRNVVSSLTVTLMLVSTVFILCITPIVVYPIGDPYWKDGASERKLAELFFWESCANIVMYVNNSINCVLYFFSGSKFREELKKLLCPSKYGGASFGHSHTAATS